jgi:hypothetical protein
MSPLLPAVLGPVLCILAMAVSLVIVTLRERGN